MAACYRWYAGRNSIKFLFNYKYIKAVQKSLTFCTACAKMFLYEQSFDEIYINI